VVDSTAASIKKFLSKKDMAAPITHLAVSGVSGQSIGWPVSYKIGLPVCVVRRPNEGAHTSGLLIGNGEMGNYVILDDLISSGKTINRILNAVVEEYFRQVDNGFPGHAVMKKAMPICRAIFLHNSGRETPFSSTPNPDKIFAAGPEMVWDQKLKDGMTREIEHPDIPVIGKSRW
jgi:hypothetical protein